MKKIFGLLSVLVLAVAFFSCENNKEFTFTGTFPDNTFDECTVYLLDQSKGQSRSNAIDSAVVKGNQFIFTGIAPDSIAIYYAHVDVPMAEYFLFIPEKGKINLNWVGRDNYTVTGTKTNDDYQKYRDDLKAAEALSAQTYQEFEEEKQAGEVSKERLAEMNAFWQSFEEDYVGIISSFVKKYSKSMLGEVIFRQNLFHYLRHTDKADEILAELRPSFQDTDAGIEVMARIEMAKRTSKGKPYINISGFDLNDKEVSLSDYVGKGKVVYLDFWASWCGPCRRTMPDLRDLYAEYKDRGFEIVGVSLDDNKENWAKATEEDGITWPQFSNLQGWSEPAAQSYGVSFIPFTILIDKEGKIVGKNMMKDQVVAHLEELLK